MIGRALVIAVVGGAIAGLAGVPFWIAGPVLGFVGGYDHHRRHRQLHVPLALRLLPLPETPLDVACNCELCMYRRGGVRKCACLRAPIAPNVGRVSCGAPDCVANTRRSS